MIVDILKYLTKYIVFGIILFLLITYIPINQIKNTDQIIIYVVAIVSFVMIDIILNYQNVKKYCGRFMGYKKTDNSCGCNMEKFEPNVAIDSVSVIPQLPPQLQSQATRQQEPQAQQQTYQITSDVTINKPETAPDFSKPVVQTTTKQEAETSNEMKYTELPPEMHQPLGTYDNTFTNDFDHGYTLLNTDKWSVPMRRPPVCIQEKECPVCPSMASGSLMYVKDFPMETKIPEKINMEYVQDKINKMRV